MLRSILLVTVVVVGCSGRGRSAAVSNDTPTATPIDGADPATDTAQGSPDMNPRVRSGPIPADLDPRWNSRDRDPLAPAALVKFQSLGRLSPATNHRFVLHQDGSLYHAAHTGKNTNARILYDTPLPATPTRQVSAATVSKVEKQLRKDRFLDQPPYQVDPQVEDGSLYVVTVRLDGKEHEVIYDRYAPPLVELLELVASGK